MEALNPQYVSIPERVLEALKLPVGIKHGCESIRVSIPERVLEALKRLYFPALIDYPKFQSLKGF